MDKKKNLPMYGVGPIYVAIIVLSTVIGIVLSKKNIICNVNIEEFKFVNIIIGILLIILGIFMWISAITISKIDYGIKNNKLVTTGIYAYVRNPIYSAFMFICIGIILFENNLYLLILPIFYWIFLTILMKKTEEKWLINMYGKEYEEYCKKVNRCIPYLKQSGRK